MSLAKQFLAMSGVAILAYLLVAHATGAAGILNSLGTNTSNVYKTLQGR
jgi:hypothetical protein